MIALLVLAQIAIGLATDWLPREESVWWLDVHVQLGLSLLGLMLVRLLWRLGHPPPPPPASLPPLARMGSRTVHFALYCVLFIMPVSGYLLWMWIGRDVAFLGLGAIPLPDLEGQDEFWRSLAGYTHEYAGYALFALLAGHILAALWHQFVKRDRLISQRML